MKNHNKAIVLFCLLLGMAVIAGCSSARYMQNKIFKNSLDYIRTHDISEYTEFLERYAESAEDVPEGFDEAISEIARFCEEAKYVAEHYDD